MSFYKREITREEMMKKAPSIFAMGAKETTSDKYLYIPTAQIVDGLMKNDFIPLACKQVGKGTEHGKHVVHFGHKSLLDNDVLNKAAELPLIRIQNSHDGKSSFQLDTGFFRLVCSNGLVMPASQLNSARITHRLGMENEVIEASYRILGSFDSQIKEVEAMKAIELSTEEKVILAESAVNLVFSTEQQELNKKHGVSLVNKLNFTRRNEDAKNDLWTVFNRIQENVIKGGLRVVTESGRYQRMREVTSIDREKQINVELMTLAKKMAELRQSVAA